MTNETNSACRLEEGDYADIEYSISEEGRDWAIEIADRGGSLANAREAAIAAFIRGYDKQAARTLTERATQTLRDGAMGEVE